MQETLADIRETLRDWYRGRRWAPRAPLVLWMAYLAFRHFVDSDYTSVLGALNLGIHEAGHLLFGWISWTFLTVAGGDAPPARGATGLGLDVRESQGQSVMSRVPSSTQGVRRCCKDAGGPLGFFS